MKIAILIPSRSRFPRLERCYASMITTARDRQNFSVYLGLDEDDVELGYYKRFAASYRIFAGIGSVRKNVPEIIEYLARSALYDQNDLFIIASDDIVFQTVGWDTLLKNYYLASVDRLMVGYFNNGRDRELCEHFVVSKEWIKVLGYCVPTEFNHFYVDTYIADIAKRNNRLVWMKDICLKHEHFKYGLAPYDEIYARTRKNNFPAKDEAIYNLMLSRRISDANKIRDAICGLGS